MQVQNISFNSDNLLNQTNQNVSQSSGATQPQKPDTVEISSNKKKDIIKYSAIGAGVLAAIIALIKHKQIGEFFSKFSRKEKIEPEIKPNTTETPVPTPKPPKQKSAFKLPEPEFTCGEENLEQFAQEKRAYIDSIKKYVKSENPEARMQSLKALEKYGSWEDCENLGGYMMEEDPEIIKQFVKTVGAIGKHKHSVLTSSFLRPFHNLPNDVVTEVLNAEAKLGKMYELPLVERFTTNEDEGVRKAAKNAFDKIKERNDTRTPYED